ncbi:hypothetical protein GM50_20035 [freshwater metagenome]|jgi:hypothetical protein|uniref:Uncharacterized protein n=1 Tax=freshwater metagenome TaxID=449393 RepID=A0A094QIY1_9ZZZZ
MVAQMPFYAEKISGIWPNKAGDSPDIQIFWAGTDKSPLLGV